MTVLNNLKEAIEVLVEQVLLENQPVRKHFPISLPQDLLEISKLFQANGFQFFLVGGSVRDALMGKDPKDLDVTTDAQPDQVVGILTRNPAYKILEIGKAFGVVKVITPENNEYEIATFRSETYLKDDYDHFIRFIQQKQPKNWENRLRLFAQMSKDK